MEEGQTKDVCCVGIFKVLNSDSKVAVHNKYSVSVMEGGVRTQSLSKTNLITYLKSQTFKSVEKSSCTKGCDAVIARSDETGGKSRMHERTYK